MQSDFVIGVMSGVLTLASLSLAIFGFLFSAFTQIMAQVGVEPPPRVAVLLREVALWNLVLTGLSSFIVVLCMLWLYIQKTSLLYFICISLILLLICLCSIVAYIIFKMMKVR